MSYRPWMLALLLAALPIGVRAQVVLAPTHYDLDLEVDHGAELLRGTARVVVENPSAEPLREASFLIYRLLRVASVLDDDGADLAFSQAVVGFEDFSKLQVNQVVIALAEPLAPGARAALRISMDLSGLVDDWLYTTRWAERVEASATIQELEDYYRRQN